MIGKLKGVVDGVGAEEALIDVGGVVYVVACGARTLARMPALGAAATLHIETVVREDAFRLYGFHSEAERAWFVRLTSVQGVGAKVALAVLDVLEPAAISAAAEREDKAAVARAKGVGPRVAQRIIAELKGKPAPATRYGGMATPPATSDAPPDAATAPVNGDFVARDDAVSALVNLGFPDADARAAVMAAEAECEGDDLDALVKTAIKALGR